MKNRLLPLVALLAAVLVTPSRGQAPAEAGMRPRQAAAPMTHLAVGTVRSVDATGRSVTIDHQAIPTLDMPAMAMQFELPPSSGVALKAGQSIAFTFTASADGLTIGHVQAINPGTASAHGPSQPGRSMSGMGQHGMQGMGDMKSMKGMMDSCQGMMRDPLGTR